MPKPKQSNNLQSLSLHQLQTDIENIEPYVSDSTLKKQIQRAKNELIDFEKILRKKQSYTQEEVDKLAEEINDLAEKLQIHTKSLLSERAKIAGLYAAFLPNHDVIGIRANLENAQRNFKNVRDHSHGYERTPLEKLSRACHHVRKGIVSFFKTALSIKEHGRNAPIFKQMKETMTWPPKNMPIDETKPQIFKRKNKW